MILSDGDIKVLLKSGELVVEPLDDPDVQIQPSSIDLRLSPRFLVFRREKSPYIDPFAEDPLEFTEEVVIEDGEPFVIHPGEFVLGATVERVKIPDYIVARVDGRSSLGRLGILIHATAGFVDPGFSGVITLEITNVNVMPVALYPGMRICQISFDRLSSPAVRPYGPGRGKYWGQMGHIPSRIRRDRET